MTRAFIGTQLREEGFEVVAAASVAPATLQLKKSGIRPVLIIVDTGEQDLSESVVAPLSKLCPNTPLVLIQGANEQPSSIRWPSRVYQLARPITVAPIAETVKELSK